jgi:hypothetical protein
MSSIRFCGIGVEETPVFIPTQIWIVLEKVNAARARRGVTMGPSTQNVPAHPTQDWRSPFWVERVGFVDGVPVAPAFIVRSYLYSWPPRANGVGYPTFLAHIPISTKTYTVVIVRTFAASTKIAFNYFTSVVAKAFAMFVVRPTSRSGIFVDVVHHFVEVVRRSVVCWSICSQPAIDMPWEWRVGSRTARLRAGMFVTALGAGYNVLDNSIV